MNSTPRPVLVVDFGAQYAQLIARRVREASIYSEIVPHTMSVADMLAKDPAAIILSGGPSSVYEEGAPSIDPAIFDAGVPLLGICYGFQTMAAVLGGTVGRTGTREYGHTDACVGASSCLFAGTPADQVVWMSHGDAVQAAPEGFEVTASTSETPVAAFEDRSRKLFGLQWHPEVGHSQFGQDALKNFLYKGAGLEPSWTAGSIIDEQVEAIRKQVGDAQVICALSGGVDSTVVAVLLHKAIGKNLHCIFVDNGVLRSGEGDEVVTYLREHFDLNLKLVNAQDRFLDLLAGVEDPEKKRKIIGHTFIDVFDEEARAIGNVEWLAQGTLYPDVIESVSHKGPSAVIKSHHNVGGLPEKMNMKLIEPLRELFKDEVRQVGAELGMPESVIWRQPFPGPGLAIRVIGEVTRERLDILRKADTIVQQELRDAGWYRKIWQGFAVLLPLKTVGVMGDGRTYEHVIALRCVDSVDAMTADWARLPYDLLERISRRIINEVKGVNRVVYDVSSKPPSTIEWE